MDSSPAIRCRGLVKDYGTVRAVNGLDLEIPSGECFGLLGPNGAGKTTTIEILEGLLPATSGEVELLGRNWKTGRDSLRQRLGISLQETNLADKLTGTWVFNRAMSTGFGAPGRGRPEGQRGGSGRERDRRGLLVGSRLCARADAAIRAGAVALRPSAAATARVVPWHPGPGDRGSV